MNTDKQDARNSIENSIYKTAFKLHSVQTLCQLDLINSSLIQQVLLYQGLGEMREKCLSTPQLFQALQDLFQRLEVKRPGWVSPRASELTLSLLTAMYDSTGTGFVKLIPTIAALIALSGDSPLTKYRALFQLYTENNRGGKDSGNRMTRRVLRNLLTDLQQIPTVVGESRALCSVESATRSCFRGVLSPAIKEEKFLSWLESEPLILLWLPTCYRLSATEMVTHPVRCRICSNFPVTGVRYSCVKCLNFDICQSCFLSDLHGKPHEKSYPAIQHCAQMSAKENTKLLVSSLRNKLLQRHWRRTEAARSRQWLLDQGNPKDIANQERVRRLFTRCTNPEVPIYVSSPGPAATKASKNVPEMTPQVQQTNHSSPHRQTIVSLKNELWRNREYIHALQKERRLLKKQLNRCKNKMQIISAFQEETSYRLETKILELKTNQETLWTKLQKMGQDLQAMLQPLYSSSSCQSTVSKTDDGKGERLLRRDSSEIRNISGGGSEKKYLSYPTLINRSHQSQANVDYALPNANFPEATLQSRSTQTTKVQNQEEKMWNEAISVLPSSHEGLSQTTHQITPADINNSPALTPVGRKETIHNQEGKDELEEEELNQLLSKLTDAFTLDMPSGLQSSVNMDLYRGAELVCGAFSVLVDQITLPNLK
ncbi:dystrotelin [Sorex fumeus]|uniref:dystrotelin n=1 Tax=Sorex fumeus TaxID=62283 RepID=UPI0024AC9636|nr:dystrotelin [Sorex fumeus]